MHRILRAVVELVVPRCFWFEYTFTELWRGFDARDRVPNLSTLLYLETVAFM